MLIKFLVRPAVTPDIEYLSKIDHTVKTDKVWQMATMNSTDSMGTVFKETQLPRVMRLVYPRSPETLVTRWGDFNAVFVGCIDEAPVSYLSVSTIFSENLVWIKDLVVAQIYRRQGIATRMIQHAQQWGKDRNIKRISAEMSSKNYPAISLVKNLKFNFTGYNDNYFKNNDIALFFSRES